MAHNDPVFLNDLASVGMEEQLEKNLDIVNFRLCMMFEAIVVVHLTLTRTTQPLRFIIQPHCNFADPKKSLILMHPTEEDYDSSYLF